MGIWALRHLFSQIAAILITLFAAVLFIHAFIDHDHQQESFGIGTMLPVHNATGEKFFTIMLPTSLFIAFSTILFARNIFLEVRLRGRKQHPHTLTLNAERRLFARGILHTKVY